MSQSSADIDKAMVDLEHKINIAVVDVGTKKSLESHYQKPLAQIAELFLRIKSWIESPERLIPPTSIK